MASKPTALGLHAPDTMQLALSPDRALISYLCKKQTLFHHAHCCFLQYMLCLCAGQCFIMPGYLETSFSMQCSNLVKRCKNGSAVVKASTVMHLRLQAARTGKRMGRTGARAATSVRKGLTFLKPVSQLGVHIGAHWLVLLAGGLLAKRGQH